MRILLVEDDVRLSAALVKLLQADNFAVDTAFNGTDGQDAALTGIYDALVLDVMLPGKDGFQVLAALRQAGVKTPVLMLTARGGLEDRVHGLETGADYYLPKPFEERELLACLHALTRRKETTIVQELAFGNISLHKEDAALHCAETGKSIRLPAREYQLMEIFLRNPRQVLPRERLVERVWGFNDEAEYNNLAVYLSFLRKKLAFLGAEVELRAMRGLGYMLEEKT